MISNNNNNNNNENPLVSLFFNILIPVIILKNGDSWIGKILNHLNENDWIYRSMKNVNVTSFIFLIALIFPVAYFIYDFIKRKNINLISILGFVNILLTGGIGVFGGKYGLSKNWFILKEGMMPTLIGLVLIIFRKYKQQSFNSFLLNDIIFDNDKIKNFISKENKTRYDEIVKMAGHHLIAGFFISSIIQFILASLIVVSNPGEPSFNQEVSTMTWVSYIAVLVPTMLIVGRGYFLLISGIEKISGLNKEDFLKS